MKKTIFLLFLAISFVSCKNVEDTEDYETVHCPPEIKKRAYNFAEIYRDTDSEYEFGRQDPCRSVKIDCSGLIIMCYKYAIVDTEYSLIESDMTAAYMAENASIKTETPEQGDLVFMGESESDTITHIAIFNKMENYSVYFIDSTEKDTDNDGIMDINGVTERSYAKSDNRIKSFGIMKLRK